MAKYKAYPEYKDSGVELLGEVPLTWRVFKLKFGLSEPLVYGANEAALDDNPDNPRYIRITDMNPDGTLRNDTFKSLPKVISEPYMLIDGDILLARSGATVGKSFYYKSIFGPSCFAGYLIRARFNSDKIIPRLAYWFFQSSIYWQYVSGSQIQATIQNVSAEKYSDLYLSAPLEYAEQALVADFLDHETAKIDNLIEKQQQLIELLKEKCQAVISHAVTKGLNPDVPMKDSGVEWLGDVPEHWIIKRLKHISPKVGVGLVINPSTYTKDEGVYFIFGGDVKEFGFDLTKTRRISTQDSNKLLPSRLNSRDLVSVRVGYPGITAVVTDDLEGSNCASIIIIRRGSYNSDWLCAAMNVWVGRQQVDLASYGAAQKQFNVSDAIEFVFPVPSINEQNDIADFVQKTLNKFDDLTQKALKQIEFLQERRTALISAAVTGKIDVRDWIAPDTQDVKESQEATA